MAEQNQLDIAILESSALLSPRQTDETGGDPMPPGMKLQQEKEQQARGLVDLKLCLEVHGTYLLLYYTVPITHL